MQYVIEAVCLPEGEFGLGLVKCLQFTRQGLFSGRREDDPSALGAYVHLVAVMHSYLFPDATTTRSIVTNAAQAYATPRDGALGSCGRNSGRRPGFIQLDLNILKEFKLHGSSRIQARWEIFNVTNRVNLGTLQSSSVRSGVFGTVASTPDVDRGNPVIAQGGPRAMQWALKVRF